MRLIATVCVFFWYAAGGALRVTMEVLFVIPSIVATLCNQDTNGWKSFPFDVIQPWMERRWQHSQQIVQGWEKQGSASDKDTLLRPLDK